MRNACLILLRSPCALSWFGTWAQAAAGFAAVGARRVPQATSEAERAFALRVSVNGGTCGEQAGIKLRPAAEASHRTASSLGASACRFRIEALSHSASPPARM